MAAKRVTADQSIIAQIGYWRGIRLDFPARKTEALHHIDNLLDDLLKKRNSDGP